MPDDAPVATTAAPAEDLSPAVAPAPITIPNPDAMMAAIKERIAKATAPEPKKVDAKPADEPTLNIDPKTMKTLGRLQQEARDLGAKVKELEPLKPDAEFGKTIRDMWKGTPEQRLEALAKLSGRDGTDELAALVTFFYERDQQTAANADPAKPTATPEMKAVLDRLDAVSKELAEIKSKGTNDAEADAKKSADRERAEAGAWVERFLTANKATFEISARKENVAEATDLIQAAAFAMVERDRIDMKSLTEEAANDLYLKAAAEVEKEYEETGKRFAKAQPKWAFDPDNYPKLLSKPTVVVKKETPSNDPKVREQQLRERLLRKAENGELGRG